MTKKTAPDRSANRQILNLRILDQNHEINPLEVKFQQMANQWLPAIESLWPRSHIEIFFEVDGSVFSVAPKAAALIGRRFSTELFGDKNIPNPSVVSPAQVAWTYFASFALRGLNQFPRRHSWTQITGLFDPDQIQNEKEFRSQLQWLAHAKAPDENDREREIKLEASRNLALLIRQKGALTATNTSKLCMALNKVLTEVPALLNATQKAGKAHSVQVTRNLAAPVRWLASQALVSDHYRVHLHRLWLEACLHNPEPIPPRERKKAGAPLDHFDGLVRSIVEIPLTPLLLGEFTAVPIYLPKASRLLGMICIQGPQAAGQNQRIEQLGTLIDAFIVHVVKDLKMFMGGAFQVKAAETENEVLETLNQLGAGYLGANDSCVRFLTGNDKLRCVHANCQYQHAEFGPNFGVEGRGTVQDNLEDRKRHGEIIDDYLHDTRHIAACSQFVGDPHYLTFYDGASLHGKLRHANEFGIFVLSDLEKDYYSKADFVDMMAICRIAEMRLDELVAKAYRSHLQQRMTGAPLEQSIYRNIIRNLNGEGPAAFLDAQGLRHNPSYCALISRTNPDPKVDVYRDRGNALIDKREFVEHVIQWTKNQDAVRAFWVAKDCRTLWMDMFHNSRMPQKTTKILTKRVAKPRLAVMVPLPAKGDYALWIERDLTSEECDDPRKVLSKEPWDKLDEALAKLRVEIDAEWLGTLRKNAEVGQVARLVMHNIRSLVNNAGIAFAKFEENVQKLPSKVAKSLNKSGLAAVGESLFQIDPAIEMCLSIAKPIDLTPRAADRLLDQLWASLMKESKMGDIKVVLEKDPALFQYSVNVHFDQLAVAFRELMNNARDAMVGKSAKRVWLSGKVEGNHLYIGFEDSGDGIMPSVKKTLFENEISTKGADRGMGLYIAENLINAHQGGIRVDDAQKGNGARFTIDLPLSRKKV